MRSRRVRPSTAEGSEHPAQATRQAKPSSGRADYYPYGGARVIASNVTNYYQFTGYEKDFETGYYYAVNRIQSSNLGRFFSPDRIPGTVDNPQSWNRYPYVLNNPLAGIDPLGLVCSGNIGDDRDTACNPSNSGGGGGRGSGWSAWDIMSIPVNFTDNINTYYPGNSYSYWNSAYSVDRGSGFTIGNGAGEWTSDQGNVSGMWMSYSQVAGEYYNRTTGYVLGKLGQLFQGRPQQMSFNDCVNQNVKLMTDGTVYPQKLFSAGLGAAEGLATAMATLRVSSISVGGQVRPMSLLTQLLRIGTGTLGLTGTARVMTVTAGVAMGRTLAVAGAATAGTLIGSAANCASIGVH